MMLRSTSTHNRKISLQNNQYTQHKRAFPGYSLICTVVWHQITQAFYTGKIQQMMSSPVWRALSLEKFIVHQYCSHNESSPNASSNICMKRIQINCIGTSGQKTLMSGCDARQYIILQTIYLQGAEFRSDRSIIKAQTCEYELPHKNLGSQKSIPLFSSAFGNSSLKQNCVFSYNQIALSGLAGQYLYAMRV